MFIIFPFFGVKWFFRYPLWCLMSSYIWNRWTYSGFFLMIFRASVKYLMIENDVDKIIAENASDKFSFIRTHLDLVQISKRLLGSWRQSASPSTWPLRCLDYLAPKHPCLHRRSMRRIQRTEIVHLALDNDSPVIVILFYLQIYFVKIRSVWVYDFAFSAIV